MIALEHYAKKRKPQMLSVTIIGGGIGGLTLANALQHHGIDFDLHEQAEELREVGAAIGISHGAMNILNQLGLADDIQKNSTTAKRVHAADHTLKPFRVMHVKNPGKILHRAKLVEVLAKNLPKNKIQLNKKLVDVDSLPAQTTLYFSDNTTHQSTFTVMADGIHSLARKKFLPGVRIRYANQVVWRGIANLAMPESYATTYIEIWHQAKRFIFARLTDTTTCWVAVVNGAPHGKDNAATVREDLQREFESYHPFVREVLANTPSFIRNDILDLGDHREPWHHNRLIFLGDAIHATTPNLAQGGCMAIEDAWCLSLLIHRFKTDFKTIADQYWKLRRDKTHHVVSTSWRVGKMMHTSWQVTLLKLFMRYAPDSLIDQQQNKLDDLSYLEKIT
jgi:2-polyprenyl-6-methoxyphenol hydroxylase-like FAD-dependent oxidoreductase